MDTLKTRSEIVIRRTYSRPLNEEETQYESWNDICMRVQDHQKWLWERALGRELNLVEKEELIDFYQLMLEKKCSVSGRTLWLGGTELSKIRESSMFNPLKADTKFVTATGVKSFLDFKHGDIIDVPTHTGNIQKAQVMNAGIREMVNITFTRNNSEEIISSCVDHTWLLNTGKRVTSKYLSLGDKVQRSPVDNFFGIDFWDLTEEQQFYWCYGFVYGDGSIAKAGTSLSSRVRLCGEKQKHLDKFIACGFEFSYPPSCNSDPFVYTGKYLKDLPEESDDIELKKAFLMGYLAADGEKAIRHGKEVITSLSTTNEEAKDFVLTYLPVFGVYIKKCIQEERQTNFGKFIGWNIQFQTFQKTGGYLYTVTNIERTSPEECYCLTVENDHTFILPSGIVSGNCSGIVVETVYDMVDVLWLLMQGCGVGFKPKVGTLNGFFKPIPTIDVIRTKRTSKGGLESNVETFENGVWTIKIGDSAEAWSKSIGKILAGKYPADKLVFDFSELRPAGSRLKGYGWISSGDEAISKAFVAIAQIMNKKAGELLSRIDILDIVNWLGTILSSRRSAQIALFEYDQPEWEEFAIAKKEFWNGNPQRSQSNNSLVFYSKPSKKELQHIFDMMQEAGGSEPGLICGTTALTRAPWFKLLNPCAEVLLPNKGFCNLVEIDVSKFFGDTSGLLKTIYLAARANYRQTLVNLNDGILQEAWHLNNEFFRLCGIGLTGIAQRPDLSEYDLELMKREAISAAYSMADELGLQRPKNISLIKPSGTLSKVMECTEGLHTPLGKYIFNNVNFGKHDPLLPALKDAGYKVWNNPLDPEGILVTFPIKWENVPFTKVKTPHGIVEVNQETAIEQLERYKKYQVHWCQQNVSCTISYEPKEVPQIINWLLNNWDIYVGVSFLYKADPTKTAQDLGYAYLPQEVVTKEVYEEYVSSLKEFIMPNTDSNDNEIDSSDCASGMCPIK